MVFPFVPVIPTTSSERRGVAVHAAAARAIATRTSVTTITGTRVGTGESSPSTKSATAPRDSASFTWFQPMGSLATAHREEIARLRPSANLGEPPKRRSSRRPPFERQRARAPARPASSSSFRSDIDHHVGGSKNEFDVRPLWGAPPRRGDLAARACRCRRRWDGMSPRPNRRLRRLAQRQPLHVGEPHRGAGVGALGVGTLWSAGSPWACFNAS